MSHRLPATSTRQPTAIMIIGRPTAVIGVIHGFRSVLVSGAATTAVTIMGIMAAATTMVAAIMAATTVAATTVAVITVEAILVEAITGAMREVIAAVVPAPVVQVETPVAVGLFIPAAVVPAAIPAALPQPARPVEAVQLSIPALAGRSMPLVTVAQGSIPVVVPRPVPPVEVVPWLIPAADHQVIPVDALQSALPASHVPLVLPVVVGQSILGQAAQFPRGA